MARQLLATADGSNWLITSPLQKMSGIG